MANSRTIPAGLIDNNIEFFTDPSDQEKCYCLTGGMVTRVRECSDLIKEMISRDMQMHPEKIEALVMLGYENLDDQLEKYCSCCFGAFDGMADVKDGKFLYAEYVPCIHRGNCPAEGKLCNALMVGTNNFLTQREIQVLTLVGKCLYDKEIADTLGISIETAKIHLKHIREKSGLMNKQDMVKLAIQKNLV